MKVSVQRVPMFGTVLTFFTISGEMFKQVAKMAKLQKRDFKPPDETPRNYDEQQFHLDCHMDLDVSKVIKP